MNRAEGKEFVASSGARRGTDEMFFAAARTLADLSPAIGDPDGSLYPDSTTIRDVSRRVALAVAQMAQSQGHADVNSPPELEHRIRAKIWSPRYPRPPELERRFLKLHNWILLNNTSLIKDYGFAVVAVGLATALCSLLSPLFDPTNLAMIYLLSALGVAVRGRRGPVVFASILSVLCFNFFFIPPRLTLQVADPQSLWTFVVLFVTVMITSHLTLRLKAEANAAEEGQRRMVMMHTLNETLSSARDSEKMAQLSADYLTGVFSAPVSILIPDAMGRLPLTGLSDKDRGTAQWVHDSGQSGGPGTESLLDADALFVPLRGAETPAGVLRLEKRLTEGAQRQLLNSYADQIGLSLEVARLAESYRRAEAAAENERLRSSLLSLVSHDLRTPLTAILGSADVLLERDDVRRNPPVQSLLQNIQSESERLSRLISNLLDAQRMESGSFHLVKERCPLEEVIGTVLERCSKTLLSREVRVDLPEDLPPVPLDSLLIEQVFHNLLENAVRCSPPGSSLEIVARVKAGEVEVSVADQGTGIKESELEAVFDKFYKGPVSPGSGLGLAICRAVVNVHGGRIWAENGPSHGAIFRFTLPLL